MTRLTDGDRDALWSALRSIRHEDAPVSILSEGVKSHALWATAPAVEQIVARHVAAALNDAADEIESNVDWSNGRNNYGDNEGYAHAARIVRARAT